MVEPRNTASQKRKRRKRIRLRMEGSGDLEREKGASIGWCGKMPAGVGVALDLGDSGLLRPLCVAGGGFCVLGLSAICAVGGLGARGACVEAGKAVEWAL